MSTFGTPKREPRATKELTDEMSQGCHDMNPLPYSKDSSAFAGMAPVSGASSSCQHEDANGAAFFTACDPHDLRKNAYAMLNGFPSKIRDISRSAPGKHGSAKHKVTGTGLFDGKKRETIFNHSADVPFVRTGTVLGAVADAALKTVTLGPDAPFNLPPQVATNSDEVAAAKAEAGTRVSLDLLFTCGHHKVVGVKLAPVAETAPAAATDAEAQPLSKKDQRKAKKAAAIKAAAADQPKAPADEPHVPKQDEDSPGP